MATPPRAGRAPFARIVPAPPAVLAGPAPASAPPGTLPVVFGAILLGLGIVVVLSGLTMDTTAPVSSRTWDSDDSVHNLGLLARSVGLAVAGAGAAACGMVLLAAGLVVGAIWDREEGS